MKKALILGAGFAGCTAAHRLQLQGNWEVLMVESGKHLGADSRTLWHGEHAYTQGPEIYVGSSGHVFEYLHSVLPMQPLVQEQLGCLKEEAGAFGDSASSSAAACKRMELAWLEDVGRALFPGAFGEQPESRDGAGRAPSEFSYPLAHSGYNDFFGFTTQCATLLLDAQLQRIDLESKTVWMDGGRLSFDVIINTAPIDDLFGQCYGRLKFIGMQHSVRVLPLEQALPAGVHVCYHRGDSLSTRSTEYKKFTGVRSPNTLLGLEQPLLEARTHALPFIEEKRLARRYISDLPDDVFSIGRLGRYRVGKGVASEIADGLEVGRLLGSTAAV